MQKGKYVLAALLLLVFCIIPAKATLPTSEYMDVPASHPHAEAIYMCTKAGYISGVGDECFAPDDLITLNQYLSIILKMFYPECMKESDELWSEQVERIAGELNLVSTYELASKQQQCNWIWMLNILFDATAFIAYSPTLLGVDYEENDLTVPDRAILASAKRYGLLDGLQIIDHTGVPSRSEAVRLLYNAKTASVWKPDIVEEFTAIQFIGDQTDVDKSAAYEVLLTIPQSIRQRFIDENWELLILDKPFYELIPEFKKYGDANGLCDYSRKTVYIRSPFSFNPAYSILHEFSHYLSYTTMVKIPIDIFNDERESLAEIIREYSGSNQNEAFADVCSVYLAAKKRQEQYPGTMEISRSQQMMESLEKLAPASCQAVRAALEKVGEGV